MKDNQAIIEKLKKILILANNAGATEGEVASAMARAKEIAMRHAIDIGGIDITNAKERKSILQTDKAESKIRSKHPQRYHRFICGVFKQVFGVESVQTWSRASDGPCYVFIGESTDVAICTALFPWLEEVFCKLPFKVIREKGFPESNGVKNAVYQGLYYGIIESNKKAEAALSSDDKNKWAVVVRNKDVAVQARLHQEFPRLTQGRSSRLTTNSAAQQHGYEAGRKINLSQVGGGAARKQVS
jgi:hypothetical protein